MQMTAVGGTPDTGYYSVIDELEVQKSICDFLAAHPNNIALESDLKVSTLLHLAPILLSWICWFALEAQVCFNVHASCLPNTV